MKTLIKIARNNPLIADVAEEIEALWISLGKPESPGGPSTDVRGWVPAWLVPGDLEGMEEAEATVQVARYNNALEQLLDLTGIWNAGGDVWLTTWNKGTDQWENYTAGSWELALDHIAKKLWDDFCDTL